MRINDLPISPANGPVHFRIDAQLCIDGSTVYVEAGAFVPTEADAQALAAQFPKSLGIRGTRIAGLNFPERGFVKLALRLVSNGSTGAANETAIRKYRSLRKHLARLGHTVEFSAGATYLTEDDLNRHLAAQEAAAR